MTDKPTKKRGRQSKAENITRVNKTVELLTMGFTRAQIIQFGSEKASWGVSDRSIDVYIAQAREILRSQSEADRAVEIGRALERLDDLYRRNMGIQDFKSALAVVKERNNMLGLNAPVETKQSGEVEVVVRYANRR